MKDVKVNVYTTAGSHVGYFLNPAIEAFPEGDYEVSGHFFDSNGERVARLEFNPESVPYVVDLRELDGVAHEKLHNVYVQRGRQPIRMSGSAIH